MATFLGKVETKVLPSFNSAAIVLAVFTQKLEVLLTALNVMILILFRTRISTHIKFINIFLGIDGLVW